MDFLGDQNITLKQIQNYAVHQGATLPITGEIAQMFYRTGDSKLFIYTSSGWAMLGNTTINTNSKSGVDIYYINSNYIGIQSGVIEISNSVVKRNIPQALAMTTPSNWLNGTLTNNMFVYVYVRIDSNGFAARLSDEAPQYSSTLLATDGTLRYRQYSGTWYRYVGAFRYGTAQIEKFYKYKNLTVYDDYKAIATNTSIPPNAEVTFSMINAVPTTSSLALFKITRGNAFATKMWTTGYASDTTTNISDFLSTGSYGSIIDCVFVNLMVDSSKSISLYSPSATSSNIYISTVGYYEEF